MNPLFKKMARYGRIFIFIIVGLAHLFLVMHFKISMKSQEEPAEPLVQVMKLVDVEESVPTLPAVPPVEKKEVLQVNEQPAASEKIIEVETEVVEVEEEINAVYEVISHEPEYLPQHKISKIPEIPADDILKRIIYPPMALRQKLEAVVYLELFIDNEGIIRKIEVLRDPGNGFAEAAVDALNGIICRPAQVNGESVAVRFRYPIIFTLK